MCRVLGIVSKKPISPIYFFKDAKNSLIELSKYHCHGWGVAWYENNKLKVYKEPIAAYKSSNLEKIVKEIRSCLILAHIRRKSKKFRYNPCLEDTHPFFYQKYCFVHNGDLPYRRRLLRILYLKDTFRKELKGHTGSEVIFYYFLQHYIKYGLKKLSVLFKLLKEIGEFRNLIFLFSDGKYLLGCKYIAKEEATAKIKHTLYIHINKDKIILSSIPFKELNPVEVKNKTLLRIDKDTLTVKKYELV